MTDHPQLKILWPIVVTHAVLVMHNFVRSKQSAQHLFHYKL